MKRFNVELNNDAADFMEKLAFESKQSVRDVFRQMVERYRTEKKEEESTGRDKRRKTTKFLEHIREHWSYAEAVITLDLDYDEVDSWFEDLDFLRKHELAQRLFLDKHERKMIEVGDSRKGNVLGYVKFLEAHHPSYGRLRRETINRLLGKLVQRLIKYLEAELGLSHREALKRAFAKFESFKRMRVAVYTDSGVK